MDEADSDPTLYALPSVESKTFQEKIADSVKAFKSWWSRKDNDEGDGAVV
jgi:hypothetical protein